MRAIQKQVFKIVQKENNDQAGAQIEEALAGLSEAERTAAGLSPAATRRFLTPWFRTFLTLEPAEYLCQVRCPVLVLNGEKDLQVSPSQNLPAIERALKQGGNAAVKVVTFEGHNHLFQRSTTGSPLEYAEIEATISPIVLDSIATWVLARISHEG